MPTRQPRPLRALLTLTITVGLVAALGCTGVEVRDHGRPASTAGPSGPAPTPTASEPAPAPAPTPAPTASDPPPVPPPAKAADGAACDRPEDCQSGVCEGEGCGAGQGRCAAANRACTRDLVPYCGCDGLTFRTSSGCPGKRFARRGECS
jgi:hypothetical protein